MLDEDPFATAQQRELEELSEAVLDEEAQRSQSALPILHDIVDELYEKVAAREYVGLILVDTSNLEAWERRHGAKLFTALMGRLAEAAKAARGEAIRNDDDVCLDMPGGDTVLLFLSQPRSDGMQASPSVDMDDVMARFKRQLFEPFSAAKMSFHEALDSISMGCALLLHNSSVDPRREIYRAIRRARADAEVNFHEMQRRRHRVVGHMIAHQKIRTMYQPIVGLPDRRILGYEALSRAESTDASELGVHLFVAASRAELDGELDQACRTLSVDRRPEMDRQTKLFVNCLPPTFFEPNRELNELVQRWLADGLDPSQLVFEITEQITYEQAIRIMPTVQNLRDRGFLFALDDVGTGAANLRLLADLDPEFIKMDLTLTQGIHQSRRKRDLAQYLLDLADKTGAQLIAEGIEEKAELETIIDLGIELGQGYFLGRPKPAEKWLAGQEFE